MIFCAWDYRNEPIFRPQSQCDAEIPSVFAFQPAVHKQTNAVQHLYKINYCDCDAYVGQTGKKLKIKFSEHQKHI